RQSKSSGGTKSAEGASPDLTGLLANHRVSLFASERLGKGFHVRNRSIPAEMRQRVRVCIGLQPRRLRPLIRAPHLLPTQKKPLLRREPINILRPLPLNRFFVSR